MEGMENKSDIKPCFNIIKDNDHLIIKNNENLKGFQIRKDRTVHIGKSKFRLTGALGHPYGTTFSILRNELVKAGEDEPDGENQSTEAAVDIETNKDNRNLQDISENQKLSTEDLLALKKKGLSGAHIVEHLIENSSTFKDKTEFSQAKYLKKKKKRWEERITILKPSVRLVSQMYYQKGAARLGHLRMDSIAQLLTYGNVRAHSKVMICENMSGLLVAAVLDRLGGYGNLVQFYMGSHPSREALEFFNFSADIKKVMTAYPVDRVNVLYGGEFSDKAETSSKTEPNGASPSDKDTDAQEAECVADEENGSDVSDVEQPTSKGKHFQGKRKKKELTPEERKLRRERRIEELNQCKAMLHEKDMDVLLVATKQHPTPIVLALVEFLAPSRPIVVHCAYKEPLMDCFVQLRNRGCAINLQLSETWMRDQQVLPMRTHPVINMSGTGGYLLTGISVEK